jgi:uncharacterized protein
MPFDMGVVAIARAFESLQPGGALNLGFFGGEPLLEAGRIVEWMEHARRSAVQREKGVSFSLTTNGTITSERAWIIMLSADMDLAVSFDANPAIHDRHRRTTHNEGTAAMVERTLSRLLGVGKSFTTVVVVRPDNLQEIPEGIEYLYAMGVRRVNLSLDLWTRWTAQDAKNLDDLVTRLAEKWFRWLPEFSLNWFDAKVSELARLPGNEQAVRCGFGAGEIAVAPSGRLYPCERVVGEDRPDNPLRLAGNVREGTDFLSPSIGAFSRCGPCSECVLNFACDTFCRCSNFIRTGDVNRPDGLLCTLNKSTARAVADVLNRRQFHNLNSDKEKCYA